MLLGCSCVDYVPEPISFNSGSLLNSIAQARLVSGSLRFLCDFRPEHPGVHGLMLATAPWKHLKLPLLIPKLRYRDKPPVFILHFLFYNTSTIAFLYNHLVVLSYNANQ